MGELEKGYRDKETGKFYKINERRYYGGGGGCTGCLLAPFKALFFIGFVVPLKWPFWTFPRYLKRKNKILFWLYILAWLALFGWSFLASDNPSLLEKLKQTHENVIPARKATVSADAANFREGPSTDAKILKTLKKGDALTVTGDSSGGWTPVEHDGARGFVSADLLSVEED